MLGDNEDDEGDDDDDEENKKEEELSHFQRQVQRMLSLRKGPT